MVLRLDLIELIQQVLVLRRKLLVLRLELHYHLVLLLVKLFVLFRFRLHVSQRLLQLAHLLAVRYLKVLEVFLQLLIQLLRFFALLDQ